MKTPATIRFTFSKEERLSKKKLIDELFTHGSSFSLPPLRVIMRAGTYDFRFPAQVLVSASSKNFPLATDRNQIRRHLREAYRLNKHELYEALGKKEKQLLVALLYSGKKKEPFSLVHEKVIASLKKIISSL
jgi:ribonuclease P protein component